MTEAGDPLIEALPPATDYLTYLTLLEYQLTPAQLPLLHNLLQDEKLTTNIGWDLVNLLLPMLPQSTECLQDVARLGNPREVILRVSEALMQLQPDDDDEDDEIATPGLPQHTLRFNCLLAMLSVLHARIQTKSPSRFIATSLQAALEAYTAIPSSETTLALLEFLRDVSPTKRPAPPPRSLSESSVLRVAEASAPDPEAEVQSPSPSADNEAALVRKFVQFGLLELLKSYILSFSGPIDPGMSWAIRMQEHLHPELRMPEQSQTEAYATDKELKERDMIMGKIVALSRDVGIDSNQLLYIISQSPTSQPPPLDFDEPPRSADEIPLESHGSLLLLAARAAGATLFASANPMPSLPVFPDLAQIFGHFVGGHNNLDEIAYGQPQALLDSLVALTIHATQQPVPAPSSDTEFKNFVFALTACTARQSHGIVRQMPATIVRSHASPLTRFKLIHKILQDENLQPARDSAISWLKDEFTNSCATASSDEKNIFLNPLHFQVLFPHLFHTPNSSADLVTYWTRLTQIHGPPLHSALSLYYLLLSSPSLRDQLQLEKTLEDFRSNTLLPLRQLFRTFEVDLTKNGGEGLIEMAVGEEMCAVGMTATQLIALTLDQIEDVVAEEFGAGEMGLLGYEDEDLVRVDVIRSEMEF